MERTDSLRTRPVRSHQAVQRLVAVLVRVLLALAVVAAALLYVELERPGLLASGYHALAGDGANGLARLLA